MPDGQTRSRGQQLDPVEEAVGVGELGVAGRADAVSRPTATPRAAAISAVTLAPGSNPPSPGLAPWLSFTSIARTGADATRSFRRCEVEAPCRVPAAEVGGADLEHQLAAVAVVHRQAALAGVLEAAGQGGPPVQGLDGRAPTASRSSCPRRSPPESGRNAAAPAAGPAEHLGAGKPRLLAGGRRRRRHRPPEGGVLHDRVAPSARCRCRCRSRSSCSPASTRRRPTGAGRG